MTPSPCSVRRPAGTRTTAACPTWSASFRPASEEFRVRWAAHDVGFHRAATKQMHHPLVGDLTLAYETLELPADPGLWVLTYAEPGSQSEEAMRDIARWSETRTKLSAARAGSEA